ncbi:insulinase family protein [Pasteurella skyensis]|uniref:M16 family metallopeptidase n=1 Tax=Phocoenobacter skyensis TaxID=97481 RepID=UPI0027575324|nr:M16 family metallopeptidase [Pasteurella skyensis]MDP8177488.1 insulinase family protein [Pasteurella skyensis]MDP8200084.1 insulinase family protein [Pasteurella skyensis]
MKKLIYLVCILLVSCLQFANAESSKEKITYQKGTLANGLEYLIFKVPNAGDRIDVRLRVKVGSVDEMPNEYGSAHMLEHLVFQGGKKFPMGSWNYLMKQGWERGRQYNASTGYEHTTYTFSPPKGKAQLNQLFDILADMMFSPSLTSQAWDKERKIVLEEWRSQSSPFKRLRKQYLNSLRSGSRYTHSEIIGSEQGIKTRKVAVLQQFHKRWYQPNNMQLLVVAGDIPIQTIEKQIKQTFSVKPQHSLPKRDRSYYEPKLKSGWTVSQIQEKDSNGNSVAIIFRNTQDLAGKDKITQPKKDQLARVDDELRERLVDGFVVSTVNNRLKKLKKVFPEHLVNIYLRKTYLGHHTSGMILNAEITDNIHSLTTDKLLTIREQLLRSPITASEMQDYIKDVQDLIKKEKKKTDFSDEFSNVLQTAQYFLFDDLPIRTPAQSAKSMEGILKTITVADVNKRLIQWLNSQDKILQLQAPALTKVALPSTKELEKKVQNLAKAQLNTFNLDKEQKKALTKLPKPIQSGDITKEITYPKQSVTEWYLNNGDKFVYLESKLAKDNVSMTIEAPIGYMAKDLNPWKTKLAVKFIWFSGPKGFDKTSLKDWHKKNETTLFHRKMKSKYWLLQGLGKKDKLDKLFHLYQAQLLSAQIDKDDFKLSKIRTVQKLNSPIYAKNIQRREALAKLLYGKQEYKQPTPQDINTLTADDLFAQWKVLQKIPVTYYLIADMPSKDIKPLVKKYLTGIPRDKQPVKFTPYEPISGTGKAILNQNSEQRTDFAAITWQPQTATPETNLQLHFANQLTYKYLQIALRDNEQGVYSVRFSSNVSPYNNRIRSMLSFSSESARTQLLWKKSQQVLKEFSDKITQTELNQMLINFRKKEKLKLAQPKIWLSRLRASYLYYGNPNYLSEMYHLEQAVTLDQIKAISKKLWNNDNLCILQIDPEN